MKKIALPYILILIMILATACGSPTPAATPAPAQPAATQPPAATEPQPQSSPTAEVAPAGNTQATITLADNTIEASLTSFQVGVPYTFVVTNAGRHGHNFNVSTPVAIAGSLDQALSSALLAIPKSQLDPGESVTVEYTFPDSAAGQQLEFSCLITRHYQDGMYLAIAVAK